MTKIKKVLAALLALLMIFSSVSVMAFADDSTVNGTTVTFATKFFKQVAALKTRVLITDTG